MPEAAEASSELLQGSTLHRNVGSGSGASAWAAGACLVEEAALGGGDVGVVHLGESVK